MSRQRSMVGVAAGAALTAADSTPGPLPAMDEPMATEPEAGESPAA